MSELVVLVLGAGRGERLGGPKALLCLEGRPLAALHAERAPAGARVVVVVRAHVAEKLAPLGLDLVVSEEPDELGPAGSIRAAVAASVLDDAERVLITPVDVPPCPPDRLALLLAALDSHDAPRRRQAARFERGHPVALRAAVLRERYRSGAPVLRDVLRDLGDDCVRLVGVEGPADLDTPDDVRRLTGAGPTFFA